MARFGAVGHKARWAQVKQRNDAQMAALAGNVTGFLPDWSDCERPGSRYQCTDENFCTDMWMDGVRILWRMATAAAWQCDAPATALVQKHVAFFSAGPSKVYTGYTMGGQPIFQDADERCFLAMAATTAVHSTSAAARKEWWAALLAAQPDDYYCASLRMVALLFASGLMTEHAKANVSRTAVLA